MAKGGVSQKPPRRWKNRQTPCPAKLGDNYFRFLGGFQCNFGRFSGLITGFNLIKAKFR